MGKKRNSNLKNKSTFKKDFNFKGGELFQRMDYLLKLGNLLYSTNFSIANTYFSMMKDIKKRNALRIEGKYKKLICEKCHNFLYLDKDTHIELMSKNLKIIIDII